MNIDDLNDEQDTLKDKSDIFDLFKAGIKNNPCDIDKEISIQELFSSSKLKGIDDKIDINFPKLHEIINASIRKAFEKREIKTTNNRLRQLESELINVKKELNEYKNNEKVIMINTMTNKEAKKTILDLYKSGEVYYYSDIVNKTNLDLRQVVKICNGLEKQGVLVHG